MYRSSLRTALACASLIATAPVMACDSEPYIGSVCVTAANFCPTPYYLPATGTVVPINNYQALFALIGTYYGGNGSTTFALPDLRGRVPIGTGQGPGLSNVILGQQRGQEALTLNATQLPAHTHTATFTATSGSQQVTIPATQGANLNLPGTVGVVPARASGTGTNFTPAAGSTYQLAGASAAAPSSLTGPYSTETLPAQPAHVSGVSVDAAGMTPNIPEKQVNITTVTGGAVTVNPTAQPSSQVSTLPPQLGLTWCIAVNGIYPSRP